jgi:hypothetical protein
LSATDLLEIVDQIADRAMHAIERATQAISTMPVGAQPILSEIMVQLHAIGHAADATLAGTGADLNTEWGISAP